MSENPTATELSRLLAADARRVCQHLLPAGREDHGNWVVGSVDGEQGKSLHIRLDGEKAGVWFDFASKDKGDMIGLWCAVRRLAIKDAYIEAADFLGIAIHTETKEHSKTWKKIQSEMGQGTERDIADLTAMRRLPSDRGIRLALEHGTLFFGPVSDHTDTGSVVHHHSWILTDVSRRGAQARRMDGKPWSNGGKAKTIHGTEARWPIGAANVGSLDVAMVEGGPDMLAAYTALAMLGAHEQIQAVSMLGSSQGIHPESVPLLRDRTIWLFPHNDENLAGLTGAAHWSDRLVKAGCTVIPFDFQPYPGVKDLNDFVSALGGPEPSTTPPSASEDIEFEILS